MQSLNRYLVCTALVSFVVAVFHELLPVNDTTVALTMLLVVLATATRYGLRESLFTSVLCMLSFNYFFLPPVGTLTISDPENWIALLAFIITAFVATQLSAKAKARAEEATARSLEIGRLYRLSRAMLMEQGGDLKPVSLTAIRDIFGLSHIAFCEGDTNEIHSLDLGPIRPAEMVECAERDVPLVHDDVVITPVRLGTRVIGSLGFAGQQLSKPEQESIASLVAIGYERTRALDRAAVAEAGRQSERLKTFVLDGIAHDLKTPLTAIKTCVSTLITAPPSSDQQRTELLEIVSEETDRLQRTITEAMQLARVESDKISLARSVWSVADLFTSLAAHSDRIRTHVTPDLSVNVDGDLFLQALKQLVENARKYSTQDIDLTAERQSGSVLIKVSDRGPGVSPHDLEHIFEKFYRGKRGHGVEGTGMGLAIAKGIIEAHEGTIWAESRAGGGSTFVIKLSCA